VSKHLVRLAERLNEPLGELHCVSFAYRTSLQDGKFVAAKAGHEIGTPQDLTQPLGNTFQQRIADRMSEGIVHLFEVVEINPVKGESVSGF
jgi:hypothetical protein